MFSIIKKYLKQLFSPIDQEFKQEFHNEIFHVNIYRLKALIYLMVIYSLFLLVTDIYLSELWKKLELDIYVILDIIFISVNIISLIVFNINKKSDIVLFLKKAFIYFLPLFIMAWTAIIGGLEYSYSQGFPTFIIALFFISAILFFSLRTYLLFTFVGFIALSLTIYCSYEIDQTVLLRYFTIVPVILLAILIQRMLYAAKVKDFLQKKEIEKINTRLHQSEKNLKQKIQAKTLELTKSNEELKKAIVKAEESDKLKTSFLQNMSHEIRTPMNAIVGFADMLNQADLDKEKCNNYVEIIITSSNQLLEIVEDILKISTLEAGQEAVYLSETPVNSILHDLKTKFEHLAKTKNLQLFFKKELSDNDSIIMTDRSKLLLVLNNMIKNGLKFCFEGFVEFGYTLQHDFLQFYVKDTGIGIRTEIHDKIFDRFWQAETGNSRKYGGTGLGLAISKAYVELMGGEIWLKSAPNKGTIFFFTIPYKPVNKAQQEQKQIASVNWNNKTILVAEDEEINFLYLEELLMETGAKIIHAVNGNLALEYTDKYKPDLILMDLKMPVMSGEQATQRIKQKYPHIPIIAQTAYTLTKDKQRALDSGCDDYLSKPINKGHLLKTLSKFLA